MKIKMRSKRSKRSRPAPLASLAPLVPLALALALAASALAACSTGGGSKTSLAPTTSAATTAADATSAEASSADATSAEASSALAGGNAGSGAEASAEAGAPDTSKEVELILYIIGDRPAKQDEIDANFNKLLKEKMNTTLKINWIGFAEYTNKYPLLFSSGEKFDLAYTATWLNAASLAKKGAFKNLDELWPAYAPKNFARQTESAKRQATVDGHYYYVPTLLPTYSSFGPIYRTDILKDTDWDGKLESWEDYETYLGYVKKHTDLEPVEIYQMGSELDEIYLFSQGIYSIKGSVDDFLFIDPFDAQPRLFTYYEWDKTPEFLDMINRWNEAGYFSKSALSDTDSTKLQYGKAASRIHNLDTYTERYVEQPDWGIKFACFNTDPSYNSFVQDAVVISNTSENPERAMMFYELLTSEEDVFRALYYGIEGVSYEVYDGGQFKLLDTDSYFTSNFWAARTQEFTLDAYGAPAERKEYQAAWNAYIKDGVGSQKFRSLNIDISSIETEYAACQNVQQQYWWPLELGYTDPVSGLEEYKKQMEAAGIEKVRDALQGQLDAYLASLG
jgi:putative aldouronate transport system substrate-binding protein